MRRTALLLVLIALLRTPAVSAQEDSQAAGRDKSPMAARAIGIIPGAGHMYAGETRRGFMYLGGTAGVLLLGSVALATGCAGAALADEDCHADQSLDVLTAVILGVWGWSIYDAGRAAHRTNAKRRLGRVSLIVAPAIPAARPVNERSVRFGLSLETR